MVVVVVVVVVVLVHVGSIIRHVVPANAPAQGPTVAGRDQTLRGWAGLDLDRRRSSRCGRGRGRP